MKGSYGDPVPEFESIICEYISIKYYTELYSLLIMHDTVSKYFYNTATHYFFPELIGNDAEVTCTLNSPSLYVLVSKVWHNGTILKVASGSIITIEFDIVKDKTHNQEYSCVGYDPLYRIIEYLDVSVLALSEFSKYKSLFSLHGFIIDWFSFCSTSTCINYAYSEPWHCYSW